METNCESIAFWRAVVWKDGYGDPFYHIKYSTQAGYYYGGHDPCQNGDNMGVGIRWTDCTLYWYRPMSFYVLLCACVGFSYSLLSLIQAALEYKPQQK